MVMAFPVELRMTAYHRNNYKPDLKCVEWDVKPCSTNQAYKPGTYPNAKSVSDCSLLPH